MEIQIRNAELGDIKSIIELLCNNLTAYRPDSNEISDIARIFFSQPNIYSIVAVVQDVIVGYAVMLKEYKIRGGSVGHIEDVCTSKVFRKRGIGSLLVKHLQNIAIADDIYKIILSSEEGNLKFYRSLGFVDKEYSLIRRLDGAK